MTTKLPSSKNQNNLLTVKGLKTYFYTEDGVVKAVDGVDFSVRAGEVLGIVGESGCGKSVTSMSLLRLIGTPGQIVEGEVLFGEDDLLDLSEDEMRDIRGKRISMIFQQPTTALNPVFTVGDQIKEALQVHEGVSDQEAERRTEQLLAMVGIPDPRRRMQSYPHQMSGGMCQRVMIAMALACQPDLLIADEPTTALDVTVQAQIFDLLRKLQRDKGTAIMLITHDMGAVAEMADRVMVMYAGRVIEQGTTEQVLSRPSHPYTQGLIDCLPELGSSQREDRIALTEIPGMVPSIWELASGCAFRDRCPHAMARCAREVPPMLNAGDGHRAACWLLDEETHA